MQLIDRARKTAQQVRRAVDPTSPMALMPITVLLAAEQSVVYVPGRVVNAMTQAFRGDGKTDAKDARVIAETAWLRSDLSEVTNPDALVVELTQLTGYRTDLMADWVRGINRLRARLGSIFPTLEAAFDYSNRAPLILVAALCTPSEIRAAGIEGVTPNLTENKAWPAGIIMTTATAVALADQRALALPGFGPGLGTEFVVATGGNLASFATAGRLASYAGLVPVPRDSGRISGNLHRPKRQTRRLHRVFYMAALSSIRANGPSRQFYDRKRGERFVQTQVLPTLVRRLVDVLGALLRDGHEFTPQMPTPITTTG